MNEDLIVVVQADQDIQVVTVGEAGPPGADGTASLIADLASTSDVAKGDALLGAKLSATGSVATTLHLVHERHVTILDFIDNATIPHADLFGTYTSDLRTQIQAAINTGKNVDLLGRTIYANGLTQNTNGQVLFSSTGIAKVIKNANGALLTCSGTEVQAWNISFRGDAAVPVFTGDGVVASGDNFALINCGSRWCPGRPVKATGNHTQILGTCDIYQTTDASATGYDIEIGVSDTATLYHELEGIYSSQATGGILLTDVGSHTIVGGQIGKLTIAAGTSPTGTNGGKVLGSRILGNVNVALSSAVFAATQFGAVTVTFAAGTSGHQCGETNTFANGYTLTDLSTGSNVYDPAQITLTAYTPAWTGAVSDPVIGNGTISGRWSKRGKVVDVAIEVTMGSSTTYGSGAWFFGLPFIPSTGLSFWGGASMLDSGTNFRVGVVQSLTDGTARCQVVGDSAAAANSSSNPFTWATGDKLKFSLHYIAG